MASVIQSLPGQQPPAAGEIEQPAAVSSSTSSTSAWESSGSIGPFFGVISVLAVLAILSCILGRVCSHRRAVAQPQPPSLDTFKHRGCNLGWWEKWKSRCRWCSGGDIELGANKVMALGDQDCNTNKNGEVDQQPAAQA